jgi:enoyl-CoA hydratase/carnithine racemase
VRLGVPTIVGALRLPDRVGWSNAMELLLTGDRVDAQRARDMSLAWKVVPRAELMDEAHNLADRLLQAAPLAARATKEVATRGRSLPWVEAVRFGETMRRVAAATEDAAEGLAAARERRPPTWRGR